MVVFLAQVTGDEIGDLLLVLDWLHVRVVENESQVVPDLSLLLDLVVLGKGLPHDCDEHVQEMNQQNET